MIRILNLLPWFLAGSSIASFATEHFIRGGITLALAIMCGWIEEAYRHEFR